MKLKYKGIKKRIKFSGHVTINVSGVISVNDCIDKETGRGIPESVYSDAEVEYNDLDIIENDLMEKVSEIIIQKVDWDKIESNGKCMIGLPNCISNEPDSIRRYRLFTEKENAK